MVSKITIFYSYSSDDEKLRERLGQHLTGLRDSGLIDEYGTHQVDPGDVRSESITTDLQKAQIILLLVSRNSLGSKDPLYQEELKQILKQYDEGKSRIIPILLRPYRLENTVFAKFKSLPSDGRPVMRRDDPEAAFDSIAESLDALIKKLIKDDQAKELVKDDQAKGQMKDDQAKDEQAKDNRAKDNTPVPLQSSLSYTDVPHSHGTPYRAISDELHLMPKFLPYYIFVILSILLFLFALNIIHFTWFFFTILILYFLLSIIIFFLRLSSNTAWIEMPKSIFEYWKSILLSRYYSQMYREELRKEHQFSDVKSLNNHAANGLKLEQVYIDLSINSIAAHRAAPNLFSLPASEGSPFLQYLSSFEPSNRSSKIRLVLMGTPGSGKTTLLKYLALSLAQQKEDLLHFKSYLPVFLSLYDLVGDIKKNPTGFTLAHATYNYLQKKSDIVFPLPWFQRFLKRGHCFILLDGLNDISELATRKQIIEWVQKQMRSFDKCHFILTSRAYAYKDCRLVEVSEKEVQSFGEQQIKEFVRNWYLANEQESRASHISDGSESAEELASDLFQQIRRKSDLSALAVNPLLLTMITNIDSSDKKLPNKRISLYKEICEVFLGQHPEDADNIEDFSSDMKKKILQHLAYKMMDDGKRELSLKEVEEVIAECLSLVKSNFVSDTLIELLQRSGLLELNPPGVYGFAHLAFQEFFAAMYMEENKLENELISHKTDTWWRETIRLYCALTDATTFIESCLSEDNLSVKSLELALDCEKEASFILKSTRDRLNARLLQHIESADLEMRRVVAEERLSQRLRQMRQLQKGMHIDTSLVSCAEYQVFLNERLKSSQFCQPDHWIERSFPVGTGNQPILGVRFADAIAFCEWLTKRENGLWLYRLPTASEAHSGLGEYQETAWKEEKIGFWVQEKEVELFEAPLSEEEIKKLWTGEYAKAFDRICKRALDFDYISAIISESDNFLKDFKFVDEHLSKTLNDLKSAFVKSRDRTLISPVEESAKRDLSVAKSISFLHVRRNLQNLIDYFDKVLLVQSAQRKMIKRPFMNKKEDPLMVALEQMIAKYLELHVTFLILEQRASGDLPAWEGILLIKERKNDSETSKVSVTT